MFKPYLLHMLYFSSSPPFFHFQATSEGFSCTCSGNAVPVAAGAAIGATVGICAGVCVGYMYAKKYGGGHGGNGGGNNVQVGSKCSNDSKKADCSSTDNNQPDAGAEDMNNSGRSVSIEVDAEKREIDIAAVE